jgi:hypothetical protein
VLGCAGGQARGGARAGRRAAHHQPGCRGPAQPARLPVGQQSGRAARVGRLAGVPCSAPSDNFQLFLQLCPACWKCLLDAADYGAAILWMDFTISVSLAQVVLKVSTPLDWGLSGGAPDRDAIGQDCWHPGNDRFAQVCQHRSSNGRYPPGSGPWSFQCFLAMSSLGHACAGAGLCTKAGQQR